MKRTAHVLSSRFGKTAAHAAGLAFTAALLSSCSTPNPNLCPGAAILADTARLTMLRPGAPADPSAELYTVALTGVTTDCHLDKRAGQTDSTLNLMFKAVRPPGADAARYSVPYFVAVTMADRVVNKRIYTARFAFAPGASTATFNVSPEDTIIHLGNGHLPWDFQLTAAFQLTQAQIDYNNKMARYVP